MRVARLMNPVYIYHRREHIVPFIKSRARRVTRPVLDLPHTLAAHGFPVTANDQKQAAFKDEDKGERCFVIGNGPSLGVSDLDRLRGETTFAAKKIWRPCRMCQTTRLMRWLPFRLWNATHPTDCGLTSRSSCAC